MDCIILAAGIGYRMKKKIPKQFLRINGKPIIIFSLETCECVDPIENIYITYHPLYINLYKKTLKSYNLSKYHLIEGGSTRQKSVWNALEKVKSERVLIHEASRPFITKDFIEGLLEYEGDAIVPTIPIPFTVSEGNTYMTAELDRSRLHNVQLPQVFNTKILKKAHIKAMEENYTATEDGILVYRAGYPVRFVQGIENNIKITTPLDMIIGEFIHRRVGLN